MIAIAIAIVVLVVLGALVGDGEPSHDLSIDIACNGYDYRDRE